MLPRRRAAAEVRDDHAHAELLPLVRAALRVLAVRAPERADRVAAVRGHAAGEVLVAEVLPRPEGADADDLAGVGDVDQPRGVLGGQRGGGGERGEQHPPA